MLETLFSITLQCCNASVISTLERLPSLLEFSRLQFMTHGVIGLPVIFSLLPVIVTIYQNICIKTDKQTDSGLFLLYIRAYPWLPAYTDFSVHTY